MSSSPATPEQTLTAEVAETPKLTLFRGKLRFWGTAVPLVALDLWSKAAVFAFLRVSGPGGATSFPDYTIWGDPVHFHLVAWLNTGTIWGLFKEWTLPLTVLRSLALVLLLYFAARSSSRARLQLHVLGLIFAGALGNLYDNLTQPNGGVRDFLLFFVREEGGRRQFPAFNVADSCITVGAFALILLLWRSEKAQKAP